MLKRLIDISVSASLLLLLSPLFFVLFLLIRFRLGSPVFFSQMRPGLKGQGFRLIKFRSMLEAFDEHGNLLPDGERLTKFGRFLRSTSLDELPELWNVLKGEMSLVGPRPLLMDYLPLYTEEQKQRHNVRPGITGWAQVNGRNALSWESKFELDVWYVKNQSLWLDLKILGTTFKKVVQREDIQAEGQATAMRFMGTVSSTNEYLSE